MVTLTERRKQLPQMSIKEVPMHTTHTTFLRRKSCAEVTMRDLIWMWELMRPFTTQDQLLLSCRLRKIQQSLADLPLRPIHTFKSQEKISKPRFKGLKNVY